VGVKEMELDNKNKDPIYEGFEQGPIRPPSEAYSLLIRVTRNCPWNRCTFCSVYKESRFSIRPVDHVKTDIDEIYRHVSTILNLADNKGNISRSDLRKMADNIMPWDMQAFNAAYHWIAGGMKSVFLQDANSLIIKPSDLIEILNHIRKRFPWIERITSYARSHTVSRISDEDLKAIREAGLDRIHIGLESGSDEVLKMTNKGVTKEQHIKAGQKAKKAGMELSEYVMPGLGGKKLSDIHALETADALNNINPDFIRLRSLALPEGIPLYEQYRKGDFEKCTDLMTAKEIYKFIENLNGITSRVVSDHMLNLFQEVEGTLPEDKDRMLKILRTFIDMTPEKQCLYQVGRRLGYYARLSDIDNPELKFRVEERIARLNITVDNVDGVLNEVTRRFV
jgi:radical SAM superfamily enzyme YgiQ (UPF0313 family)